MTTTRNIVNVVLRHEGSTYTDHAADRGGPTKYGITQRTLEKYRDEPVTAADVQALSEAEARQIYEKFYIVAPGFVNLPQQIQTQVVDDGVLSGPQTATKDLQLALGVTPVDGILGPKTLAAVHNHTDLRKLNNEIVVQRAERLSRIVRDDPSQARWIHGWIHRALSFIN